MMISVECSFPMKFMKWVFLLLLFWQSGKQNVWEVSWILIEMATNVRYNVLYGCGILINTLAACYTDLSLAIPSHKFVFRHVAYIQKGQPGHQGWVFLISGLRWFQCVATICTEMNLCRWETLWFLFSLGNMKNSPPCLLSRDAGKDILLDFVVVASAFFGSVSRNSISLRMSEYVG